MLVAGCSDDSVSCADPGLAAETDPLLGQPVETTDQNGCRALKPRRRVDGPETVEDHRWTPGGPLVVSAGKGSIEVVAGSVSGVKVTSRLFVTVPADTSDDEVNAAFQSEYARITINEFPGIYQAVGVGIYALPAPREVYGVDLRIEVPVAFDGWLKIEQDIGKVRVAFSGDSPNVEIASRGACDLALGPRAAYLKVDCDSITASVADIPADLLTGFLQSYGGDVALSFADVPENKSFVVSATAASGVDPGNAASVACVVNEYDSWLKVGCGPAPEKAPGYSVSATPPGKIVLGF